MSELLKPGCEPGALTVRMGCPFLGSGVCREEVVGASRPVMQGRGLGGQQGKAPGREACPAYLLVTALSRTGLHLQEKSPPRLR